jgi:hypothetical protein
MSVEGLFVVSKLELVPAGSWVGEFVFRELEIPHTSVSGDVTQAAVKMHSTREIWKPH